MIAEDTGTPTPLRGIATLVVRITDRNDNDPRFDPVSQAIPTTYVPHIPRPTTYVPHIPHTKAYISDCLY